MCKGYDFINHIVRNLEIFQAVQQNLSGFFPTFNLHLFMQENTTWGKVSELKLEL